MPAAASAAIVSAATHLASSLQHAAATVQTSKAEHDISDGQSSDRVARKKQKKLEKNYPELTHSSNAKLQSFAKISDLQSLVLYLLADGPSPQWISVRHSQNFAKVLVLMVPGLDAGLFAGQVPLEAAPAESDDIIADLQGSTRSGPYLSIAPDDYFPVKLSTQKLPPPLQPLGDLFSHLWQVKTPGDFKRIHSPLYAMLSSPIPKSKEDKFKKGPKPPPESRDWVNKRTKITEYIMTRVELIENGFALHPAHLTSEAEVEVERLRRHKAVQSPEDGFVDILDITSVTEGNAAEENIQAGSILQGRQFYVIDCEMVTTTIERFALARVSMIDWDGTLILDELVKPPDPVKDYLTPYSGITEEMMRPVTTTLPDIQQKLREILTPQSVLAGHSLDSDFRALKMAFPFVVDTTVLYPHPKGPPQKSSLKWLAQKYLGRDIQQSASSGHDSIEDAVACLDLIKQKCEKGKAWGTADAHGESIFKRLARTGRMDQQAMDKKSDMPDVEAPSDAEPRKTGAMIDWKGNMHGYAASATVVTPCSSDAEVVQGVIGAVNGTADHPDGCDFVFGRLRELEFVRGWSPSSGAGTKALDGADQDPPVAVGGATPSSLSTEELAQAVARTVGGIKTIYDSLPNRTAVIVFSGSGSPIEMIRLQELHKRHKAEFLTTKWDEMVNKWTDDEEQALRAATEKAKRGVAFVGVK